MHPRRRVAFLLLALPVLGLQAGCGDDPAGKQSPPGTPPSAAEPRTNDPTDPSTDGPTEGAATSSAPTEHGPRIVTADSHVGPMLFDRTGQAIYLFDVETTAEPRCYDACAEAWPPVLTGGEPVAGTGIEDSLLGTTRRADGATQVTYNDHPLYFYAHEAKHEVRCHDVFLNGGTWYAVRPDGDPAPPG